MLESQSKGLKKSKTATYYRGGWTFQEDDERISKSEKTRVCNPSIVVEEKTLSMDFYHRRVRNFHQGLLFESQDITPKLANKDAQRISTMRLILKLGDADMPIKLRRRQRGGQIIPRDTKIGTNGWLEGRQEQAKSQGEGKGNSQDFGSPYNQNERARARMTKPQPNLFNESLILDLTQSRLPNIKIKIQNHSKQSELDQAILDLNGSSYSLGRTISRIYLQN